MEVVLLFQKLSQKDIEIIFLDETSFTLNLIPAYGWGIKGKKLFTDSNPQSENYSILAAITPERFLGV